MGESLIIQPIRIYTACHSDCDFYQTPTFEIIVEIQNCTCDRLFNTQYIALTFSLTFPIHWANSADEKLMTFFLFSP